MSLPSVEAPAPFVVIDLSAVTDLSDAELMTVLGVAQAQFAVIRAQDPRRLSLAYADAKTALDVLSREQRRRAAAVAVRKQQLISAAVAATVPTPRRSDLAGARARQSARGAFAGIAQTDDEAW